MMSDSSKTNIILWVVAAIALIWNALGCINLFQQMSEAGRASLPPEYVVFIETRPDWALWGFALSVVIGLIGAILLFIRNRHAVKAFAISGLGAWIATIPTFATAQNSVIIGTVLSAVLAIGFAWYSARALSVRIWA